MSLGSVRFARHPRIRTSRPALASPAHPFDSSKSGEAMSANRLRARIFHDQPRYRRYRPAKTPTGFFATGSKTSHGGGWRTCGEKATGRRRGRSDIGRQVTGNKLKTESRIKTMAGRHAEGRQTMPTADLKTAFAGCLRLVGLVRVRRRIDGPAGGVARGHGGNRHRIPCTARLRAVGGLVAAGGSG